MADIKDQENKNTNTELKDEEMEQVTGGGSVEEGRNRKDNKYGNIRQ